jgi:hypothetical protein
MKKFLAIGLLALLSSTARADYFTNSFSLTATPDIDTYWNTTNSTIAMIRDCQVIPDPLRASLGDFVLRVDSAGIDGTQSFYSGGGWFGPLSGLIYLTSPLVTGTIIDDTQLFTENGIWLPGASGPQYYGFEGFYLNTIYYGSIYMDGSSSVGDSRTYNVTTVFNTTPGESVTVEAVPEPSTYALFGLGAIGMLMVLRRKKTA